MTENKLVPFNMQRALDGESAYTYDGCEVTDIRYFPHLTAEWCVVGVLNSQSQKSLLITTEDGKYKHYGLDIEQKLFMKPKIKKYYIGIYYGGLKYETTSPYISNSDVTEICRENNWRLIKIIDFEIEE
jgi:hypothetical protein